jgi:hypothetical protein
MFGALCGGFEGSFVDCEDCNDELLELFAYLIPCWGLNGLVAATP